jgi:hypothetical protein
VNTTTGTCLAMFVIYQWKARAKIYNVRLNKVTNIDGALYNIRGPRSEKS